jgi:lycopene beta-cyclase
MKHYHYIFTGSGLSALMTVYEMVLSGKFEDKSILLIDENPKKTNDRTWCFWDDTNAFDEIITKKWGSALFADEKMRRNLNLNPYQYKMIQGLDFYNQVFDAIAKRDTIVFLNQKVISFTDLGTICEVKTETETFTCDKIVNSIFNPEIVTSQIKYPLLQQHFIGWFIKSKEAVFNSDCATFMDFSVEQKGNTRFMYVLPTSKNEALLEYTLFSKELLPKSEYEAEIENYIQKLGITNYEIVEKEQGNIPMTSYKFWNSNTKNLINIGSAGGWTKASTGFTFKNVTKKSAQFVRFLDSETDFRKFHKIDKFWFYDLLFIDVLYKNNELGSTVFSALFKKGNPTLIFKFLDDETSFREDLKVIWKCPKGLFIRALFNRIVNFIMFNNWSNYQRSK